MSRHNPDACDHEHRDVVAGLRRMSDDIEMPPGLLDRVKDQESYLRYVWQEEETTSGFERFVEWLRLAWTAPARVKAAAVTVVMMGVAIGMAMGVFLFGSWRLSGPLNTAAPERRTERPEALGELASPPTVDSKPGLLTEAVFRSRSEAQWRQYREWQQVKNSSQPDVLAKFAALYPDGPYTPAVRRRLEQLRQGPCLSVRTRSPRVMPLSLLYSIESRDDLYWFYVRIHNQCDAPLHLSIHVDVRKGPARLPHDQRGVQFTVLPGESRSERIDPLLDWTSNDTHAVSELVWEIRNMADGTLEHTETARIRLLPKTWFAWDLTTPEGQPVSHDFLLASLAAWVQNPLPAAAGDCHQTGWDETPPNHRLEAASDWFEHCYQRLFHQEPPIRTTSAGTHFPPAAGQVVRSPAQIVTERTATPLEAVLLLSSLGKAMAKQLEVHVALFVLPHTVEPGAYQAFILAWTLAGSTRWQALDLQRAATLSFADNVRQASEQVNTWMRRQPGVIKALERRGVFLQDQPAQVGVDFAKAAQTFLIRGLP